MSKAPSVPEFVFKIIFGMPDPFHKVNHLVLKNHATGGVFCFTLVNFKKGKVPLTMTEHRWVKIENLNLSEIEKFKRYDWVCKKCGAKVFSIRWKPNRKMLKHKGKTCEEWAMRLVMTE